MKHTRGPWYVEGLIIKCKTPKKSGSHLIGLIWDGTRESRANAKLIAAAPDMLDALNEIELILFEALCENEITSTDKINRLHKIITQFKKLRV